MSELKDKIAKRYRWRDFDQFERNAEYIDVDFIKAVNDVCELTVENADLKQRLEALEEVDDIAGSYRDLCKHIIKTLDEEGCYPKMIEGFREEFNEIGE